VIIFPRRSIAALGLVALTLAGCSSSGGSGTSSAPPGGSSSGATTPVAGPPSGSGAPADAATTSAVTKAFATFFSPKSTAAQSQAALQHGSSFTKTLADEAKTSQAQQVSAKVTSVRLLSPNVAAVVYTLSSGGSPLLPDSPGNAVREGGTWKVAAMTFCNLLTLQGTAPAACKDASITALPH
jgi:hypothetical protein